MVFDHAAPLSRLQRQHPDRSHGCGGDATVSRRPLWQPVKRALGFYRGKVRLGGRAPVPLEILDGGHFVQEWGKEIAEAAVTAFA
jgi:hypothetical protein